MQLDLGGTKRFVWQVPLRVCRVWCTSPCARIRFRRGTGVGWFESEDRRQRWDCYSIVWRGTTRVSADRQAAIIVCLYLAAKLYKNKKNQLKSSSQPTTLIFEFITSLSRRFFWRILTGDVTSGSEARETSSDSPSDPMRGCSCKTPKRKIREQDEISKLDRAEKHVDTETRKDQRERKEGL